MNPDSKYAAQPQNVIFSASETINISVETEWMKNNKHAQLMRPQLGFQTLSSKTYDSILFSISTDNVFYVTTKTTTGWQQKDIGSSVLNEADKIYYTPKLFKVTQNPVDETITVVLVFGSPIFGDRLYAAVGLQNTDDIWDNPLPWQLRAFDGDPDTALIDIRDVYLLERYVVVDLHQSDDLNLPAKRYFLNFSNQPSGNPVWNEHDFEVSIDTVIDSVIGQRTVQDVEGVYTLGISGEHYILFYKPLGDNPPTVFNLFSESITSQAAGLMAMAVTPNSDGTTDLYVAGNNQLYYFSSDNQNNGSQALQLKLPDSTLLRDVTHLNAGVGLNLTILGLSAGVLFTTGCGAGMQTADSGLILPVPVLKNTGVISFTSSVNTGADTTAIFAQTDDDQIISCSQDIETGGWRTYSIHLPALDVNDMVEFNTYTSHISITDNSNFPKAGFSVSITSTSPVGVYINNAATHLTADSPVEVKTDEFGTITIIQETRDMSVICYTLKADGMADTLVNPILKIINTLDTIKSGSDLDNIKNSDGTVEPLFNNPEKPVSPESKQALADTFKKLVEYAPTLPQDGSVNVPISAVVLQSAPSGRTIPQPPILWGLSFNQREVRFHQGAEAIAKFAVTRPFNKSMEVAATFDDDDPGIFDSIETNVSDFFSWLEQKGEDALDVVETIVVSIVDGILNIAFTVAGKIFTFILDHLNGIMSLVSGVLRLFGVDIERLQKWLGYVFNWDDIVRTHNVFKNFFRRYIENSIANFKGYEDEFLQQFDEAKAWIDNWANIKSQAPPDTGANISQVNGSITPLAGQNHPAFNWGTYHLKNGVGNSTAVSNMSVFPTGQFNEMFQPLETAFTEFSSTLEDVQNRFKTEIIDQYQSLSFIEIIEKAVAILADLVLDALESLAQETIIFINQLLDSILEVLESPINIPVISEFYKTHISFGAELTLLDAACFISAIPVTVLFKIAFESTIFPDDDNTVQLTDAASFDQIKQILNTAPTVTDLAVAAETEPAHTPIENCYLAAGIMGLVGGVGISAITITKKAVSMKNLGNAAPPNGADVALSWLQACFYLPYASPDIIGQIPDLQNGQWWAILNQTVADVASVKQLVDAVVVTKNFASKTPIGFYEAPSAAIDSVLNLIWLIPTAAPVFYAENQNTSGVVNMAAGVCFDFSGILTLPIYLDKEPESVAAGLIIIAAANLIYGAGSVYAGNLLYNNMP
jgi:hypothetical protein